MLDVRPFAAIRYDAHRYGGNLSNVISPPYDVLDQVDRTALLARDPYNIVAIDLPHVPPKSLGPPEVYDRSAHLLTVWQNEGVLIREAAPALYVYHQTFTHEGRQYTRKKFITRLQLASFSEGIILPHERTFGGPKEDRLALMKATQCNLSPIFGLFADPRNQVAGAFDPVLKRSPDFHAELEGVENKVWIVKDAALISRICDIMQDKKVYIADGHHRYSTALMYRDHVASQAGGLSADHPANFVMFVLASMDDPGCLILPYYRVLAGASLESVIKAWRPGIEETQQSHQADMRLWEASTATELAVRFTNRPVLRKLETGQVDPWYDLDYAYLHRYLLDELLAKSLGRAPDIYYAKSLEQAGQIARDSNGVALLVNATPMAHLRTVSEAGGLMPQKSTYFYPKLATGLTINSLC